MQIKGRIVILSFDHDDYYKCLFAAHSGTSGNGQENYQDKEPQNSSSYGMEG